MESGSVLCRLHTSDAYARDYLISYSRPATLKSVRSSSGWDLAGQSKEARNERNKFTMHESIRTLATRLAYPGVAQRAQALFDMAMTRASLKWGRPAKLAAGATLAFALRESGRGDSTHDIAYLLSETPAALSRAQTRLLPQLGLSLPRALPTTHLPSLAAHLSTLSSATPTTLPLDTTAFISPLITTTALPDVLRTANGLYDLLAAPESNHPILALPLTPLAPALLLLALEAHAHPPRAVPHVLVLAALLGARLGLGGRVVMDRYRAIGQVVEDASVEVPWLVSGVETKKGRKGKTVDAKVARRVGIARATRDVVQFRQEILRTRVKEGGPVQVVFEGEVSDGEDEDGADQSTSSTVSGKRKTTPADEDDRRVRKAKKSRTDVSRATSFLLDPLSAPVSSFATPASGLSLAHTSHLLAPEAVLSAQPTRLQLLCAERGGEESIDDDELFAEGEMEGMLVADDADWASDDEDRAAVMWALWGGDDAEDTKTEAKVPAMSKADREREKESRRGMGRVDAQRFAALLSDSSYDGYEDEKTEDEPRLEPCLVGGDDEEVGEWRPVSPGGPGEWQDRYDA
ncbi:hypothetical protein BV25DRAFT_1992596 [Artomyces pyxidatus]|uniref:Uncharacterized protein n=1 Tax=Artomyces pyxidatus TaxID=48021 RepID=A0ACB8SW21_9AGAM|nr:hypothetical protein BV25DRAFT_1992596 [Artomyces pyxidatus]